VPSAQRSEAIVGCQSKAGALVMLGFCLVVGIVWPCSHPTGLGLPVTWLFAQNYANRPWLAEGATRELWWYWDQQSFFGLGWEEVNIFVNLDRRVAGGPALKIYPLRLVLDCGLAGLSGWMITRYVRRLARQRRIRHSLCVSCGYDCPECGTRMRAGNEGTGK
jgi:hypothetical protein